MEFANIRCKICGAKSTGVHYGVISCEGCKAFYKRGLGKHAKYKCYFGGTCTILSKARGRCKACRFQKCVKVGMSLQAVKMGRIPKLDKEKFFNDTSASSSKEDIVPADMAVDEDSNSAQDPEESSPMDEVLKSRSDNSVVRFSPPTLDGESSAASHFQPFGQSPGSSKSPPGKSALNDDSEPQDPSSSARTSIIKNIQSLQFAQRDFSVPFADLLTPVDASASDARAFLPRFLMHSQLADTLGIMHPNGPVSDAHTRMPTFDKSVALPTFLDKYWTAMKERNKALQKTASAVSEAVSTVYWDQIETWSAFMNTCLTHGDIPFQPQTTVDHMLHIVREAVREGVRRLGRFASLLPGFHDLDLVDQKTLVSEKWLYAWLFHHSTYICNDELYYTIGPDQLHFGRYWVDQIVDPDLVQYINSLTKEINDIQLNLVENYILMAISVFRPDTTAAHNKPLLSFLHAHYMDALFYQIGTRLPAAERAGTYAKVERIMNQFPVVHRLAVDYVMPLDMNRAPFRASTGVTVNDVVRPQR